MAKARFYLPNINLLEADDGGLLPELWPEIFKYLEPCFLFSVLTTSKLFNAAAGSNNCFNWILAFYFPEQKLPSTEGESYSLFKDLYLKETAPLSLTARKLFDLCYYFDFSQIEKFQFDPDVLLEQDAFGITLLSHINNYQNPFLRDRIFQKVHRWYLNNTKTNSFFLSFFANYHDERKILLIALKFSAALNQLHFIEQHSKHFEHNKNYPSRPNDCLIHLACQYGHIEIVAKLLELGEELKDISDEGKKPLEYAVIGNQAQLITYLLDKHRTNISSQMIQDAAYFAINDNCLEALELVLHLLKDENVDHTDLLKALLKETCIQSDQEAGALIIKMFPTLLNNEVDDYILETARTGCALLIKLFLNKVNGIARYLQSQPPIFVLAALSGNSDIVNYLLDMGAPINAPGIDNKTALHMATQEDHFDVVRVLVTRDADLTLTTPDGKTALDIARENGNETISQYLLDAPWERSKLKRTAAMEIIDPEINEPDQKRLRR